MESTSGPRDLRERLLEAAEEEIRRNGSHGLSLRALARRINVSHQAPGFVFTNRTGLFTALAETGFRLLDQRIQAARDAQPAGTSPRSTLAEMGVAYVMVAQERPALFQVMYRADLVDTRDRRLHDAKRSAFRTLFASVAAAVDDGWHQGEPIEQLALLCWSSVHGVAMLDSDGGLDFLVTATPLEVLARDAMRLLFDDKPLARDAARSTDGSAITMRVVGQEGSRP
jgi:AcrR family transcriptional regulator